MDPASRRRSRSRDWVAARAVALPAGDSARAAGLAVAQWAGAGACVRYLTGKQEFLRHDEALTAGWPIATGVVEGACRHLIGDRPGIAGTRGGSKAPKPSSPCAQ
jgi:hypothetical protein